MGDYCVGIGKIVQLHEGKTLLKPLIDLPRMRDVVREMLRAAVDAFIERDADKAEAVAQRDDEVDALYDQIYRELLTFMLNDPRTIDRATWLIWVAHNFERMGDRIQNICERTVYEARGVMREFSHSYRGESRPTS
jgi:phosphate transport system protein